MSFHGGLLGVIVAVFIYARKKKIKFFSVTDFIAPLIPIGLGLGRVETLLMENSGEDQPMGIGE